MLISIFAFVFFSQLAFGQSNQKQANNQSQTVQDNEPNAVALDNDPRSDNEKMLDYKACLKSCGYEFDDAGQENARRLCEAGCSIHLDKKQLDNNQSNKNKNKNLKKVKN